MCSHLQRKLFDAEGEYRAIREEIERDEELTAVVRSRQLHVYRNGKKILVLAGKSAPKVIREDRLLNELTIERMKEYKAIFLDWDDTIGDWSGAEHKALRDIYANYHLEVLYATAEDYIAAYKPYNLELWGMYGRGEVTKEWLHFQRFYKPIERLQDATLQDGKAYSLEEMAHKMGDEFLRLTNKYFCLMPDAERVVKYLAAKYPLTIISNGFKEVQYYKFEHSGLDPYFTHRLISEEVEINKPQPGIFEIALERNGITADEAIMIGDSYSSDIAGAKAAGIDQIWITSEGVKELTDEGLTATYIVPKITDVMKIV